jgi:uncharacterized protein YuzE
MIRKVMCSAFCFRATWLQKAAKTKTALSIDYSAQGSIVGIEVLNASRKVMHPNKLEYEMV